jgi:diguanylate cyclase (GGDEF)-like protein
MSDPRPSLPVEKAQVAAAVLAAIHAGEAGLVAVMLDLLDKLGLPFALKDASSGRYLQVNAGMVRLLGVPAERIVGATDAELLETSQTNALRAADHGALALAGGSVTEHRLELAGVKREFSVARLPVRPADGGVPRHVACLWTELTGIRARDLQLQQALSQIEQQQLAVENIRREVQDRSARDAATGLYQRAQFEDQLRREVDLSSREHREFALVSIALDGLSADAHAAGSAMTQRILEALGRLLRSNTRAMDASCRLDETRFAVLLSGVGLATAHSRMEGLRRQCATQIVAIEGRDLRFTVSMGVASFPHTAHTQDALLQAADTALADAQSRGGNHVTLASIRFESGSSEPETAGAHATRPL